MTTVYLEGAGAVGLLYFGMKKSGAVKWVLLAAGAYLAYSAYEGYAS